LPVHNSAINRLPVRSLLEEAPSRYKDVTPVIETVVDADVVSKFARLWPLLTIKGL
jgi:RNA-splicing ligase RtcB